MSAHSEVQIPPLASRRAPPVVSSVFALGGKLFLASFAALYFELVIIRYLSTEVRAFAYLKNLPLIASFFGIGLGMILGPPRKWLKTVFPIATLLLFLLIAFAQFFQLTHIPLPRADYYVWGAFPDVSKVLIPLRFLVAILGMLSLVVAVFVLLGGLVGQYMASFKPLAGYALNLAGSLMGVALFTWLAFLRLPPLAWTLLGVVCLLPFFWRQRLALVLLLLAAAVTWRPDPSTYWSPYYRIDLHPYPAPLGWSQTPAYELEVNHDFHQHILDLSDPFFARYPRFEPNHWARLSYQIPYRVVPHPKQVLVVGAGTGNDVAAALRHGVEHVDAVEIDPVILELGKRYHPEHPYDSARVSIYNDDARAYFKRTKKQYDLIVFGFLDSHTLLSSFSSLRLDNFVYTRQGFEEAGRLLGSGGALVVSFSAGRSFVNQRMYATLKTALGMAPEVYDNGYVEGRTFVVRKHQPVPRLEDLEQVTAQYSAGGDTAQLVATDQWPFLYLASRHIPRSIVWILILFLAGAFYLLRLSVTLPRVTSRRSLHLFFLGAGFLLLETKGVTELSLLFGSTWTVNAVVIAAFLAMGLLANTLVMYFSFPRGLAYLALFSLLGLNLLLPYAMLAALSAPLKTLAAGLGVGLPVLFSGMIFSRSFQDVAQPAESLGINLFGAVIGGSLENAVMIGGMASLGVLAIVLYALSAIFLWPGRTPAS